jgi:hypothetical protein
LTPSRTICDPTNHPEFLLHPIKRATNEKTSKGKKEEFSRLAVRAKPPCLMATFRLNGKSGENSPHLQGNIEEGKSKKSWGLSVVMPVAL